MIALSDDQARLDVALRPDLAIIAAHVQRGASVLDVGCGDGALMAALLFGFSTALAQRLPVFSPSAATLFQALPYVLTLIAVAGLVGRSIPPAAIGRPLERS